MENAIRDPREHHNEEPSNDLIDVGLGFIGMFTFMLVVFAAAVVVKFLIS